MKLPFWRIYYEDFSYFNVDFADGVFYSCACLCPAARLWTSLLAEDTETTPGEKGETQTD
jgi:hypothetical protein